MTDNTVVDALNLNRSGGNWWLIWLGREINSHDKRTLSVPYFTVRAKDNIFTVVAEIANAALTVVITFR